MKNEILARYFSNVFLIGLSPSVNIFNRKIDEEIPVKEYSIFTHEYWHFLMNISTTVRVRDFALFYQLFPIFSKTLTEEGNGMSDTSVLTAEDKILLSQINDMFIAYNEGGIDNPEELEINNFRIVSEVLGEDAHLTLRDCKVPFKRSKVKIEFDTPQGISQKYMYLNSDYIEESIANSIEKIIYDDGDSIPEIPYLMLSKLSAYFNGEPLSNYELACIGTLSLLTTNPALSLNSLFKDYKALRGFHTMQESIDRLSDEIKPIFSQISNIILEDLISILKVYENREPSYQAIKRVYEKIEMCLYYRERDLLFELNAFRNNILNKEILNYLVFKMVNPCDVLQERQGDENLVNRDFIKSFETDNIKVNSHDVLPYFLNQIMNCQLNYLKAHWAMFALMDSRIATSKCPYYTVCDLPNRIINTDRCLNKPWENFVKNGDNCVYGHAVGNLVGISGLK
ncbi:hypothetical protein AAEO56_13530 [Flavobacterium sp. DGU11]|uniref:Uncharacterized protein n=1 Tax=Flavobacterium arundinis TaxID=3139143 RepID=A0ABU9HZE6_9FLAO